MTLAITGGIACGKSTAATWLVSHGWNVLDCDDVVHDLLKHDKELIAQVKDLLGVDVVNADGTIHRARAAERIFQNGALRQELEKLLHPVVWSRVLQWMEDSRGPMPRAVIIPLLYEAGWDAFDWDAVLCIAASEQQILERLHARGLSVEEAKRRLDAQWPIEEKIHKSDYVIWNDRDLKPFYEQLKNLHLALQELE